MRNRSLTQPIHELALGDHKIAFVSGPRQCGKTSLSKILLRQRKIGSYYNWDELKFRRLWAQNPSAIIPKTKGKKIPLIILDEIHKHRRWKRQLKGVFDTLESPCDILVTGSAKLNVYMKGSDSLMGRYLNFRLHPFSLREMKTENVLSPDEMLESLFSRSLHKRKANNELLSSLMAYGPFPEPLFSQNIRKARIWRREHESLVVREELRDLSRLPELGRVEMLNAILPERIGSLFSLASVARDMESSPPTIKRWTNYLKALYYLFEIKPYHRSIPRSLRREGKIYLWDYGIIKNKAIRFENLVACHLLKTCHFWTDTGEGEFELFYLRNKEKQEIDFLIVRDGQPWLPVEVKLSDNKPSSNWKKFAPLLPCKRGLQIIYKPEWKIHNFDEAQVLVGGAAEILEYFV